MDLSLGDMAITDKTRKILWGRSGNRCAICRQRLVVDETTLDSESVVGDECHINSGSAAGPRYEATQNPEQLDELSNFMLLCRVHHKMVDDQQETYAAEILRSIKSNHEKWVEAKFAEAQVPPPVRIRRLKGEIPAQLSLVGSGAELFNLASSCYGSYQSHSEDLNDEEVEVVGGFLQNLKDWVDLAGNFEPMDLVRASKSLSDEIADLRHRGFLVFAAREKQRMEGGVRAPSNFFVLHVAMLRENDAKIIKFENQPGPEAF
ncbi:MAG: HNH endonuclease signature motif containing protein [Burkholderiales bacterium]